MEMMALGVAMQTMEVVRARDFDAGVDEHSKSEIIDNPESTLANTSKFGKKYNKSDDEYSGSVNCKIHHDTSESSCNFIEEFHRTNGVVPFRIEEDKDIPFSVTIKVRYVDDNLGSASGKELQKEVVISVQDNPPNGSPRLPESITYSEVIAYP
jgi:hypothetical protein